MDKIIPHLLHSRGYINNLIFNLCQTTNAPGGYPPGAFDYY